MNSFEDGSRENGSKAQNAIDRVLHRLGEAEPRAGFEQRLKLALSDRHLAATQPRRLNVWRWPAFATPGVAAVVLALIGLDFHGSRHQKSILSDSSPIPRAQYIAKLPEKAQAATAEKTRNPFPSRSSQLSIGAHPPARSTSKPGNTAESRIKSAALPGFPAPQAPLTTQERLLLRVARHPDPAAITALDPKKREEIAAVNAEAFQQFFKPSALEEKINAQQAAELPPSR